MMKLNLLHLLIEFIWYWRAKNEFRLFLSEDLFGVNALKCMKRYVVVEEKADKDCEIISELNFFPRAFGRWRGAAKEKQGLNCTVWDDIEWGRKAGVKRWKKEMGGEDKGEDIGRGETESKKKFQKRERMERTR